MGAHSFDTRVDAGTDLPQWFKEAQADDLYENGHNAYSGGIGTNTGVKVQVTGVFDNEETARDYVLGHTNKWDDLMAVKVKDESAAGYYWLVGGWCAS